MKLTGATHFCSLKRMILRRSTLSMDARAATMYCVTLFGTRALAFASATSYLGTTETISWHFFALLTTTRQERLRIVSETGSLRIRSSYLDRRKPCACPQQS